ncbi:MAG: apolipoprotein N-acyltransferase [Flavobacteriaceae bacterium]|jgi:apolipoprotein N-acyltransferase|nr:apolipoprotein N-acyltransferase [Flavobacteriaceae bacterium]
MKRIIFSVLSGLLLALSWATYGFPFLLFAAFVPLLLVEHETCVKKEKFSDRKNFGYSYLAFLIWNYGATQWLHYAKNSDGSMSWVSVLFPLLVNSFLMSFVFTLFHFVKRTAGTWYGMAFLPVIWLSFEKFHLNWELSWPWLNLGNAFADFPQFIQWYEVTGTFGGTLWVLLVNLILFYHIKAHQVTLKKIYLWKGISYAFAVIFIPSAISLARYFSYQEKSEQKLEVVLVQPAIDPYEDKYSMSGAYIVNNLLQCADKEISPNTSFVIAPETAFPGRGFVKINNLKSDIYLNEIQNWVKIQNPKLDFVSGVSLVQIYDNQQTKSARRINETSQWYDSFNSTIQVNATDSVQFYHKSKLVVGVEHFPYSSLLKPLIGEYMLDFGGTMESLGTQDHPTIFSNPYNQAKVAPLVCYESIYGEFVGEFVKKGANVIFISTNDSWWGNSQGHKQLLTYARLRAIENRRDIARSANSGISAFINQRGDIEKSLEYDVRGALRGNVNLTSELTFYAKYGDVLARIALILSGMILAYALSKRIVSWAYKRK